jgi:hypothetical protein
MRTFAKALVSLAVIAGLNLSIVTAQDVEKAPETKSKKKPADGTQNPVFAIPKEITLSEEQQAKLNEIKKEHAPKVLELTTKLDSLLTSEQKTARKTASAKAKEDGMKGKDAAAYVDEAMKLTDEQKTQRGELQVEMTNLRNAIKGQIHDFLTDEQREHFKLPKSKKLAKTI